MQDPASLINVQSVELRDDGVVQVTYAEPAEQSRRATRLRIISFEVDLVPKYLLDWIETTQDLVYAAIQEQANAETDEKLRTR